MSDPETTVPDPPAPAADPPAPPADPPKPDDLGDAGKKALDAERTARKAAEKAARDAQKKLDDIAAQNLSETDKLKKQAEDGLKLAATATERLQRANLLTALADEGLTGGTAKAAARLLDGVEFDDQDEPTNLTDALKAAKATYGEAMFTAATADPPQTPLPELHGGARPGEPAKPDSTGWFPQLNKPQKT